MAIDTKAKRNAALKDEDGMLFPDGAISSRTDRANMVGMYSQTTAPPNPFKAAVLNTSGLTIGGTAQSIGI